MRRKSIRSRVTALLLAAALALSLLPLPAMAASVGDGSKTASVSLGPHRNYLTTTAGTRLSAWQYQYKTNDSITGPAWCINYGLDFTGASLPIVGKYYASPRTAGVVANGYPQHTLDTFLELYLSKNPILAGLSEAEYAYATQVAVWASLGQISVDGVAYTSGGRERLAQPEDDTTQLRVFRAVQLILKAAQSWDRVFQTGMYIRLEEDALGGNLALPGSMTLEAVADQALYGFKLELINGRSYYTREYTFASATSTYYSDYTLALWADGAPEGTIYTDLSNRELARGTFREQAVWVLPTEGRRTELNDNLREWAGRAKLCIPADSAPSAGEITLRCGAYVMQYNIYLANNENARQQSYLLADPSKGVLTADAVLSWGSELTQVGNLLVTKTNGTGMGLAGAEFVLTGTDGSRRTGTANVEGKLAFEGLDPAVTYTLTETKAPAGYGLAEPQTVRITAARTTYITVKDSVEKQLTVRKTDAQNGYSLMGAVIRFEQIDGGFTTTRTTDHAGLICLSADELPIGSYKVYEVSAPEGYLVDSQPQTVHWDGLRDVELRFTNVRKPTLILYKCDRDSGRALQGAVLEVYRDGTLVTTVTTNNSGLAYVSDVTEGYYTVREKAAPEGYLTDDTEHGIYIDPYDPATADDPRLVITNRAKPGLRIVKYDRKTMQVMSGVTFEIWRDGVSLGKYQTDEQGEILLADITPGTYRAMEVDTGSDGHILDTAPQEIELKAGDGIRELLFFNDQKPGMRLIKVDSADPGKVIPNAVFEIKSVKGDYGPQEFTTGQDGEIDLSKLPTGAYVVTEKSCEGCIIDDAQRIILLDANEDAQFVFTNSIKPSLKIIKTSPDGTPLKNVSFRIARIEDGTHYLDRTSNEQGEILISDLEPGVYSVRETATDATHVLDVREYHVALFPGKTSTLTVENQKRPNLIVYKHDADTGEPIPDTVFEVRAADGHSVDEIKTDSEGKAELRNLLPGVYEIIEKSVPSPYLLDAPSQLVTLYPNRDHTVYFENHQKPSLTVNKVDSVTGDSLPGAKFQVIYASSSTATGEINDLGTFTTDENGQFHLTGLRDGWYKVTEVEPPAGYSIKGAAQEVYIKAGAAKTLTFENIPLSALVVWKYDSVTGEAVQGAMFQIKYLGGTSGTGGTVIGTYVTSANGSFTVTGLKAGTYIVEEVASDSGHVIDTAPQTVYISGKQQDVVQLYFGNSPKGAIMVKKIDSVTHEPLSDVEFMVTTADGTVVGDANGKFVTDSAGSFTVSDITPGTTLMVKETRARAGYLLDDAPQTVTVKAGQTVTLEFRNQPLGSLIINKLDSVTHAPLEGVLFQITYSNGSYVDNGSLSSKGLYRTDKNGQIILSGITGTVVVTEVETIKGYRIDDASRSQTIEVRANDTQQLWFYNAPVSGILIHKIDGITGKGIPGVTFLLYDGGHNPIAQETSDDRGYVWFEDLTAGRYYLRELEPAEGYLSDTGYKTVYVKMGQTSTVEWENTPITGQIQIIKKSADDNSINGLPAGTLLEGAVFEIYDKAGNVVDTIRSDRNGRAVSRTLPLGRYTIREVQAPAHYSVNPTAMTAYLEYSGQIVTFEVEDSSISTGVSIQKTGPVEAVPGQPIRYVFSRIGNTSNIALDSFYWRDQLPAQVTLNRIVTGSYNQPLAYKVVYRTNLSGDYRTLADNLSASRVYVLDTRPAVLGLAANERITEVMFVFGCVKAGFGQMEAPSFYGTVSGGLANGTSIVNVADVGGRYNGQWIQAVSRWLTTIYARTTVTLPKTGY